MSEYGRDYPDPYADDGTAPNPFLDRAISRADLDAMPPPEELVEGLLPLRGIVLLYGRRGMGKSLLAKSLAGAVSSGLPDWLDLKVSRQGMAYYVALEGWPGIHERVRAWETVHSCRMDDVTFWHERLDLKDWPTAGALGGALHAGGYSLLVVDSARAAGLGRENTEDTGRFVNGLETIRSVWDGLVVVLHNAGWNGDHERGSTLLGDACDTVIKLSGDPSGVRLLEHDKHREGEHLDRPIGLAFRKVDNTRSGVLVRTGALGADASLRDQVLGQVQTTPGLSTAGVNRELDRPDAGRSIVSRTLAQLRHQGLVENRGSDQRPQWWPVTKLALIGECAP